ncbi:type I polyketide synthase [Streptomyces sp. NPDC003379]
MVQVVLFAVMVGLGRLWLSCGVRPVAVVGHSQGEVAAACVAGVLSVVDAVRVVVVRSGALAGVLAGRGGMVSVGLGRGVVEGRLVEGLSVAGVNGPGSVVVSGELGALEGFVEACEVDGVRVRRVATDCAGHSVQVEEVRDCVLEGLRAIEPRAGEIPFCSTVTGGLLDGGELDGEYWYRNLRETVEFEQATRTLLDLGHTAFIECSPHPILTLGLEETAEDMGVDAAVLGTLRRDDGGPRRALHSLMRAYAAGVDVDLDALCPATDTRVDLPTYAFQRRHYWLERKAPHPVADPASAWRYHVGWRRVTPPPAVTGPAGAWLVVIPAQCLDADEVTQCLAALGEGGAVVREVVVDARWADREEMAEQLREVRADLGEVGDVAGIVSLLALDEAPCEEASAVPASVAGTVVLAQALDDAGVAGRLWCVTGGAVSVGADDPVTHPTQAHLWGLGQSIAVERPERWGGQVDVRGDQRDDVRSDVRAGLRAVLSGALGDEDQIALRGQETWVRRLSRAPLPDGPTGETAEGGWYKGGTVLVTGGTGGLGSHVARWLVDAGVERVVLASRRGKDAPGASELLDELARSGPSGTSGTAGSGTSGPADVVVEACDVADREALAGVLARIPRECPLTAVFHTAGVVDDGPLAAMTVPQLESVLRAKAQAALYLHELTADQDLSAFVLFSSCGNILPTVGLANYAAANAYLDGLAEFRASQGLPATSVAWGAWAGGGMNNDTLDAWLRLGGVQLMDPREATAAMGRALDLGDTLVAIADIDWERFTAFSVSRPRPLVRDLPDVRDAATAVSGPAADSGTSELASRLDGLTPGQCERVLLDVVREGITAVLGHDPDNIQPDRPFREIGLDSLTGVELRNRLNSVTGLRLPATLVFDHPTPGALARSLRERITGTASPGRTDPVTSVGTPAAADADDSTDRAVMAATDDELFAIIDDA